MSLRQASPVRLLVLAIAMFTPWLSFAQSQGLPKLEVFGGYSWYHAGGSINLVKVPDFKTGWGSQLSFNSSRWLGVAVDVNGHYNDSVSAHGVAIGPQFKLRWHRLTPFAEMLLGFQDFGPKQYRNQNTATYIFGGGIDFKINPRLSIRPFQVDYINTYYTAMSYSVQSNPFNGYRQQAGMVFNFWLPAQETRVTAICSAEPSAVDAGAPVMIAVTPKGFLPKRLLSYSYASTGGKMVGGSSTTSVDTVGLDSGSYTVTANVKDNGKGSHQQIASCQAVFSVNEPPKHPPVLSVSVDPATLTTSSSSAITAAGSSPDNRPLTYDCKASGGRLTGNGPTYTLDAAGVPDSSIAVNCTVSDDRKLSASASASVKVELPPPALNPSDFGAIQFKRDTRRPTRVDNEAKGELDRYGDALAAAPDAKGLVVGYAMTAENESKAHTKQMPEVAAQRAINTKDYLVKGKGIDAARIEVRTAGSEDQKAELWIVPAGAAFPTDGTKVVDEAKVKAIPRIALKARKGIHKRRAGRKSPHHSARIPQA